MLVPVSLPEGICGFHTMRDPEVTMGFNRKMIIHDSGDLGVPPMTCLSRGLSNKDDFEFHSAHWLK